MISAVLIPLIKILLEEHMIIERYNKKHRGNNYDTEEELMRAPDFRKYVGVIKTSWLGSKGRFFIDQCWR